MKINKTELKRGQVLAQDVMSEGNIIGDKGAVVNFYYLNNIKIANDVSEVIIEDFNSDSDNVKNLSEVGFEKNHPVDNIIERIYLADWNIDTELDILKNVKAITKKHDWRTIEGLDHVMNYYDNAQARQIVAEGILHIGMREYYEMAVIALFDEDNKVRETIIKFFLRFKEDLEIITHLIKHHKYLNDNNKKQYSEIFNKMINRAHVEKIQFKAKNDNNTELEEFCQDILENIIV